METRVILTGFMGSGKSSVAKALADKLGWRALDLDDEIECHEAMPISEIFEKNGQEHFRQTETAALKRVLKQEQIVLATGGGVLTQNTNRKLLAGELVVNLRVDPEVAYKRVSKDPDNRPLAREGLESFDRLYNERRPLYESVARQVETTGKLPDEVAEEIRSLVEDK